MAKLITAGMQSHLADTVTTLAVCWKVTRVDGKEYYFTSHDVNLDIDGCTFRADTGYTQSAIANSADLAVDNLEVEGILDSEEITEIDLRAGLFDFAYIEVFMVNWADLTDGKIKLRKGRLGQVTVTTSGVFKAELRGLTQQYSQRIVEVYTPDCRADLGDSRCKMPTNPSIRQDETAYSLNDYIRVVTNPTNGFLRRLPVINHSFEDDALTGWTTAKGTPDSTSAAGINPFDGSRYLRNTANTGQFEVYQDIDVTEFATPIDAGTMRTFFDARVGFFAGTATDTVQVIVEALDVSDVYISDVYDSTSILNSSLTTDRWYKRGGYYLAIPVNTRALRIRLIATGGTLDTSFDTETDVDGGLEEITINSHPYTTEDPVVYDKDGGTEAIGLTAGTVYYVRNRSANIISLHPSAGDATADTNALDLTASGGGSGETHLLSIEDIDGCFEYVRIWVVDNSPARTAFSKFGFNLDFEYGDNTDWTANQGTFNLDNSDNGVTPNTGQWFFRPVSEAVVEVENTVDLTTTSEISTTDIDNDLFTVNPQFYLAPTAAAQEDTMRVRIDALDASDAFVASIIDVTIVAQDYAEDVWQLFSYTKDLPSGTRKIRFNFLGTSVTGSQCNIGIDDISLQIDQKIATEGYEIYENTIYKCTTAGTTYAGQPEFDTTVPNTTTDGTVVWTAEEAWTRHATVATVTDRSTFTITITESRAVDDWFNYGVVTWLTGDNAGKSMHVRDWVNTGSTVTLMAGAPFDIQVSDKLAIMVGCDKRSALCISRFNNIINFRGEPYVPGSDEFFNYPNAK